MLMLKTATVLEAISKRRRTARPAAHTGLSKNTIFAATHSAEDALVLLDATADGLTAEHVAERLDATGPNTIEAPTKTLARRIADAFIDPFAGILAALALVSLYIDVLAVPEPQRDPSTVIVIGIMLLVSGGMKFIQEARSGNAAEALKDLVSNTCTALRDSERIEIPFDELVPGDVIRLSAGDMVPADARIITARDLFVIESALTGESEAVEKTAATTVAEGADSSALPLSACKNIVFTGTSVQNGTAMALVVATGSDTYLGGIAKMLNGRGEKSAFDRGVSSVSMLLVRLMLVMAPAVFAINAATKGNVIDALLFATSVAVGITPQMLPVIVTTSLSQGAKDLARRQVRNGVVDVIDVAQQADLQVERIERIVAVRRDARRLRHKALIGLEHRVEFELVHRNHGHAGGGRIAQPGLRGHPGKSIAVADAGGSVRARLVTDADGFAEAVDLPAPDAAYSLDAANTTVQPYALYRIEAALDGWQPLVLNGVQVFDAQQTVARLDLLPAGAAPASAVSRTGEVETDIVTIPPHTLFGGNGGSGPAPEELLPGSVLNRIVVPKKITVHLGKPSANVRNVTVSFQSYIANVASSEVYPTWDSAPGTRRTSI